MPMTLKDFVLVLVQNGHHTVMNYYVFITMPDTPWHYPFPVLGQKLAKKSKGIQVKIYREIQIV